MQFLNPAQSRVLLCCRAGSCPIVERVDDKEFTITDDYNGKVRITHEEMGILKRTIEHFESKGELSV